MRLPRTKSVITTNPTCAMTTDRKYFASGNARKRPLLFAVSVTGNSNNCDCDSDGFDAGCDSIDSRSLPRSESLAHGFPLAPPSPSPPLSDFGANSGILPRSRSIEAFDLVLRRLLTTLVPARCQWSEAETEVGEWD